MVNVGIVGLGKMGDSPTFRSSMRIKMSMSSVYATRADMYSMYCTSTPLWKRTQTSHRCSTPATSRRQLYQRLQNCMLPWCGSACSGEYMSSAEKPLCLNPVDSIALTGLAHSKGLVTQVGYHYRHIATFAEVKQLLDLGVLGTVNHVRGEAYGPVVLKSKGQHLAPRRIKAAVPCMTMPRTPSIC